MIIRDEIADALEELEGDLIEPGTDAAEQITLSIHGTSDTVTVPCVPSGLSDANLVALGPAIEEVKLAVNIRLGNFLTADNDEITIDSDFFTADSAAPRPRIGKKCTFRGRQVRILSVVEDGTRAFLKVFLGSAK